MPQSPKIEMIAPKDLKPYERNARTHSAAQIKQIAKSITEFGFRNPVLIDGVKGIIAGHARVRAALDLGLAKVPTIDCSDMSDAARRAYILADNRLAMNAVWDDGLLALEMTDLAALEGENWGLIDLGFSQHEIDKALANDDHYTAKIESPHYQPTGECPAVVDLFDHSRTAELQEEIAEANLPEEVAAFLHHAAARHTVFSFSKIAEFYAHADEPTQALMERSALVIIDFDQAIERGFVRLQGSITREYEELADEG